MQIEALYENDESNWQLSKKRRLGQTNKSDARIKEENFIKQLIEDYKAKSKSKSFTKKKK